MVMAQRLDEAGISGFPERLRAGIGNSSLRSFSRSCRLSEATLRSYLSGATYPTLDRLQQIAEAAGMSPVTLAFGDGLEDDAKGAHSGLEDLGWACLFMMATQAAGATSAEGIGQACQRLAQGLAGRQQGDQLAETILEIARRQLLRLKTEPHPSPIATRARG